MPFAKQRGQREAGGPLMRGDADGHAASSTPSPGWAGSQKPWAFPSTRKPSPAFQGEGQL